MARLDFIRGVGVFALATIALVAGPQRAEADWVEKGGLHNLSRPAFTDPARMRASDFSNPQEMQRTWDRAIVWVPAGPNKARRTTMQTLIRQYQSSGQRFPTAIYLHGCSGLWSGSSLRMKFLAQNGFLVIAPASMARKKYPQSCDPATHSGGLYRQSVTLRQYDAGHAIERARALPFVDGDNMVLIGLSEGGITTATFKPRNPRQRVKARVIEGWTCHAGWPEQAGIRAPASEPVLALVGVDDPWFQAPYLRGHCGVFMNRRNGSASIVFRDGPLAAEHEPLKYKAVQKQVLTFLRQHIDLP